MIRRQPPWPGANWLSELWRYRELFYFFAWRDIKIRYRQAVLGAMWAVLQPTFTMVVFTFMFGKFAGMPSDGIPHPIFYYSALLPWMYFAASVTSSGNSLIVNANLLTKVYFPRAILPTSAVLTGLLDFCLGSIVLIGLLAYYRIRPHWLLLLWPVFTIPLVLLSLGLGMLLASLNARFRDVKHAIPFGIQLVFFMTPIIYPPSLIPEGFRLLVTLNPLSGMIDAFRSSLLPGRQLDWLQWAISTVLALLILAAGVSYFRRTERGFADII